MYFCIEALRYVFKVLGSQMKCKFAKAFHLTSVSPLPRAPSSPVVSSSTPAGSAPAPASLLWSASASLTPSGASRHLPESSAALPLEHLLPEPPRVVLSPGNRISAVDNPLRPSSGQTNPSIRLAASPRSSPPRIRAQKALRRRRRAFPASVLLPFFRPWWARPSPSRTCTVGW